MAKNYTSETKERQCRKKIATLLSLMGFHDDDPENTIKTMRRKLLENQEKEAKKKLLAANVKKVTFKLDGKTTSSLVRLQNHLLQENNFSHAVVPKKKRSDIRRLANSKFHAKTSSSSDHETLSSNSMEIDDYSRYHVVVVEKMVNYVSDQSFEEKRFKNTQQQNGDDDDIVNDNQNLNDFITDMGGSELELVFEKRLTASDVAKAHGRLLMPVLQLKNPDFLTIDEKTKLANEENISVSVFDPERRELTLNFGQWNMRASENYVLKKQWNKVVSENGFTDNMVIQVLSFRVEEQLCFALVRV